MNMRIAGRKKDISRTINHKYSFFSPDIYYASTSSSCYSPLNRAAGQEQDPQRTPAATSVAPATSARSTPNLHSSSPSRNAQTKQQDEQDRDEQIPLLPQSTSLHHIEAKKGSPAKEKSDGMELKISTFLTSSQDFLH